MLKIQEKKKKAQRRPLDILDFFYLNCVDEKYIFQV